MKYGKNQWARISSLLVRKTPNQCKARWYEWLDPSIKKTEWSKEEDEKLLHLAKLMPTQWRTIAPVVGRTAAQCLERYQRLLDEADQKEDAEEGLTGEDVRQLRPGEVDPNPEIKPARPDPVDMDEDEREMLSEARARLANTQGKKAKRKAREKQLEQARKLASLQKRRELKQAGIAPIKKKTVERGVDYNADIPFHKKAPIGFYDVSEEKEGEMEKRDKFRAMELSKLTGKRRIDEERELQKKDAKKQKLSDSQKMPPPPIKAKEQFTERSKLTLPKPQISDQEIEEIVKIGQAGEVAHSLVSSEGASSGLLNSYSATPMPHRSQQTPMVTDKLREEARNLKAMSASQTPLLGDAVAVDAVSFEKPSRPIQTPRHLPIKTPVRDTMGINVDGFEETPRMGASIDFARLPKPKNDFEIVVPSVPKPVKQTVERVEDQYEIEERRLQQAKVDAQLNMARQTKAVQLNLPRPIVSSKFLERVKQMDGLQREMCLLILKDAVVAPVVGQTPLNGVDYLLKELVEVTDDERKRAEALIQDEVDQVPDDAHELLEEARRQVDDEITKSERLAMLKKEMQDIKTQMSAEATKAVKIEKKLGITLGGYVARSQTLRKSLLGLWKSVNAASQELDGYVGLKNREDLAIPRRLEAMQREVEELKKRESEMQQAYKDRIELLARLRGGDASAAT